MKEYLHPFLLQQNPRNDGVCQYRESQGNFIDCPASGVNYKPKQIYIAEEDNAAWIEASGYKTELECSQHASQIGEILILLRHIGIKLREASGENI